jgi:hypothetical protein
MRRPSARGGGWSFGWGFALLAALLASGPASAKRASDAEAAVRAAECAVGPFKGLYTSIDRDMENWKGPGITAALMDRTFHEFVV